MFQEDGRRALVLTPLKKYMISLDESNRKTYRQMVELTLFEGKSCKAFKCGNDDFFIQERKANQKTVAILSCDRSSEKNPFNGQEIQVRGDCKFLDIFMYEYEGEKVLRAMCVRESAELLMWDVMNNADFDIHFRSLNSLMNKSFRWPFFA